MPNILFSPTAQLVQIEDFPEDCERTVKGALYVRPGAMAVVSDGEAAHLKQRGVSFSVVGPKVPLAPPTKPGAPAKAPVQPMTGLGFLQAPTDSEK